MTGVLEPRPVTPTGILAQRLTQLAVAIAADGSVSAAVTAEARALAELASGLDPYVAAMSSPEPAPLTQLAARTQAHDWAAAAGRPALGLEQEMLSGHVEGRLLALLVRAVRARTVLEIGTFTGYATLAMAGALPPGGHVITCEVDQQVATLARAEFGRAAAGASIELRVGPALATLADLAHEGHRFDLVFLDADKAGYRAYVEALLDHDLLTDHGLLCVDNTLMQGEPWTGPSAANGLAISAFNSYLAAEPRVEQVVVPVRDGITLAMRTP